MSRLDDPAYLRTQYATSANLDARIALHERFSTARENFHDWLFEHLALPPNARVLEIGCGSGAFWERVRPKIPLTWKIVLADFSFGMIETARARFESPVSGLQGDAQAIPFVDASFDGVLANHMLYHVPNVPYALREMRRVLKRGGCLYAATNGETHLRELREVVARLTGHDMARGEHKFSLETGAVLLGGCFENVTRYDFEDALRVTGADALVAYVLSGAPFTFHSLAPEKIGAFREIVQNEIDRRGAFDITKSVGLFVAH